MHNFDNTNRNSKGISFTHRRSTFTRRTLYSILAINTRFSCRSFESSWSLRSLGTNFSSRALWSRLTSVSFWTGNTLLPSSTSSSSKALENEDMRNKPMNYYLGVWVLIGIIEMSVQRSK